MVVELSGAVKDPKDIRKDQEVKDEMARDIFGNKKVTREDKYTRKSSKYTDSEIRWEQFKIVLWIVLGGLWTYFIIQPQNW